MRGKKGREGRRRDKSKVGKGRVGEKKALEEATRDQRRIEEARG